MMPSGFSLPLRSLVTASPAHDASQEDILELARGLFPRLDRSPKLQAVFRNAQIERRGLARPLAWYAEPRTFAERNAAFVEVASELCEGVARRAIAAAGVDPGDIRGVVWVNTTGIATPSLETVLAPRLGLNPGVARLPLWGLGCAGGGAGLARAADLARAQDGPVLLMTAELCSLTLLQGDHSASNLVGSALFADGAAAAVLGGEDAEASAPLARLHATRSALIPGTRDVMGWDVVEEGLKVRFAQDIPELVLEHMAGEVSRALSTLDWDAAEHHLVHPGGVKVLDAYAEAVGLPEEALDFSRAVLRAHGNMSSVAVLFVLRRALDAGAQGRALLSSMGPGFACEQVLLDLGPGAQQAGAA